MNPLLLPVLFGAAILAATYGSLVGAGGGFIMVPILLFLFPNEDPALITAMSLTGVLLNGVSGTLAYRRLKRIDYRTGLTFALTTVPGAVLGALLVRQFGGNQDAFRLLFGVFLMAVGTYSFARPKTRVITQKSAAGGGTSYRSLVDATGRTYSYTVNVPLGVGISFLVGILSSLLGIGGGLILTPVMVTILGIPAHVATATSVFTLTFTSLAAVTTHLATGTLLREGVGALAIAAGMVLGAQFGARISQRVSSELIVRLLAVALIIVGVRLALSAL